jgi:hypothetical protein
MRNFPGPRWSIVQQVQQQWSCCDQSPSGRLLVVEPDYLPDSEVCFQPCLGPMKITPLHGGGGGAFPPHKLSPGGSRGGATIFVSPPGRGFGGNAPEVKGKIAL